MSFMQDIMAIKRLWKRKRMFLVDWSQWLGTHWLLLVVTSIYCLIRVIGLSEFLFNGPFVYIVQYYYLLVRKGQKFRTKFGCDKWWCCSNTMP
jgi:hypothetical protein